MRDSLSWKVASETCAWDTMHFLQCPICMATECPQSMKVSEDLSCGELGDPYLGTQLLSGRQNNSCRRIGPCNARPLEVFMLAQMLHDRYQVGKCLPASCMVSQQ